MASTVHVTKSPPVNVDVHGNEKQPPGVFISNVDIFHGGEGIVAARGIVIAGGRARLKNVLIKLGQIVIAHLGVKMLKEQGHDAIGIKVRQIKRCEISPTFREVVSNVSLITLKSGQPDS